MIEHYAVAHDRLQEAILDEKDSKQPLVGPEDTKAVLDQLFPNISEKMVEVVLPSVKDELGEDPFVDPDDI